MSNSLKNKGFKAHKSKNMRPKRSRGMKIHAEVTKPNTNRRQNPKQNTEQNKSGHWIWGIHASQAALNNSKRTLHKVYMTPKCAERLKIDSGRPIRGAQIQIVSPAENRQLPTRRRYPPRHCLVLRPPARLRPARGGRRGQRPTDCPRPNYRPP